MSNVNCKSHDDISNTGHVNILWLTLKQLSVRLLLLLCLEYVNMKDKSQRHKISKICFRGQSSVVLKFKSFCVINVCGMKQSNRRTSFVSSHIRTNYFYCLRYDQSLVALGEGDFCLANVTS